MTLELKAQVRNTVGKKLKSLREKGIIPGVVYGHGHKSISLEINYEEFRNVFEKAGESTLIKLMVGEHIKNVLIHDIARDPMSDKFIHVDFYQVRMDKTLTAEVQLVFVGEAPAVKNLDGILVKNITEVEVEALPKDLPHEIKVDISFLDSFDKRIRIKDLQLPVGVKVLAEPGEVVVSVEPPRTEEELKALEEKPEEKVEEVEVISEKEVEGEEKEVSEKPEKKEETKEGSAK
jgi:large subunit ribosomal protein L25